MAAGGDAEGSSALMAWLCCVIGQWPSFCSDEGFFVPTPAFGLAVFAPFPTVGKLFALAPFLFGVFVILNQYCVRLIRNMDSPQR